MEKQLGRELWNKVFRSGSMLSIFIGINVLLFCALGLLSTFEYLFTKNTTLANLITDYTGVTAFLPKLAYRFWTPFSYMFIHRELFHMLFNVLWLYWMGRILEDYIKPRQFCFLYLAGGLAGAILFIIAYNLFPAFADTLPFSPPMIGASASVMAIVVGCATYLPNYSLRLMFFGDVKLKYLAIAYVLLDLVSIAGNNPGGNFAHLGGALLGFLFIRSLKNGNDWTNIFQKAPRLKVIKNKPSSKSSSQEINQVLIDSILDKISSSGYESLTKAEKEQLFQASRKE